jgi:hypothetical protein
MISIVMPTLWKGEFYKKMLPILSTHKLVGEIVIIDNNPDNVDKEILSLEKIKYFPQKENIYVNPAWNLGVEVSSHDRICLYSDDVLFDPAVIDAVYPFMSEDKGVTGFAYESISESHQSLFRAEWERPQIVPTWAFHYRFGICMFMHKNSFHKISDDYKIYYGDTHQFDSNALLNRQNYRIENYACVTKMKSSSGNFNSIIEEDNRRYKENNPSEGLVMNFMEELEKSLL